VRDAVYQSLLTEPRMKLHLRIAEEVERRSGNRLLEAAETLAHHYRQAERPKKAFVYLAMAGAKSLRIYSFEEAGHWFDAAFSLIGTHPDCATDSQVTAALADYVQYLNFSFVPKTTTAIIERFRERIDRGGDSRPAIVSITTTLWRWCSPDAILKPTRRRTVCSRWPRESATLRPRRMR
jgi:hypothetical protein